MLASWIGVDTHGLTSAYIISDSRLSWKFGNTCKSFDYCRKVFASSEYPEIFGYAGDVLFPSIVLSRIVDMIDNNVLFSKSISCEEKSYRIFDVLSRELQEYPQDCINDIVQIIHISRETIVNEYPKFSVYSYFWSKTHGWTKKEEKIPNKSGLLLVLGSGERDFNEKYAKYARGNNSNTSRNVFHCFINALINTTDVYCGGAPQLVGIYRKPNSNGMNFGLIYNNKRYFLGAEVLNIDNYKQIPWRNDLFEICDGENKTIMYGAQRQPDILRK